MADWMSLVALAVAAQAIWLARGCRRIELRALAIGVLVVGLLMSAQPVLQNRVTTYASVLVLGLVGLRGAERLLDRGQP